jgi:indolepyruvate ferredoxin oxidoreductase beta subunit
MPANRERPLTIAILALGGEGGGVLTGWLVETAKANGYLAQSTFVAGVAQRTGATVYCVEMFPKDRAKSIGENPVFTAYPVPGDVDLVVAGEMAEIGRAIQKGFVTPNVTTLVASSHRVYSIMEKSAMGDGIIDQKPVAQIAEKAARKFVCFDMQATANETGSVISSVLLGAIAASGALPFSRETFEESIRLAGRAVEANLSGFANGYERDSAGTGPAEAVPMEAAKPSGPNGEALANRIAGSLPENVGPVALHGALRSLDYQDTNYAHAYVDQLEAILQADRAGGGEERDFALTWEVARQLALQMCYEDTIRVADLKTRRYRHERIREHVAAAPGQPMHVAEYFHPRIEEICDTLSAPIAEFILRSAGLKRIIGALFSKGRIVKKTKIGGFLMLYMISRLRRWRRGTYRYKVQQRLIGEWLESVRNALGEDYDYALSLARCIEIVKGYGDTYQRGLTRFRTTVGAVKESASTDRAAAVRRLHTAALADEKGRIFDDAVSALEHRAQET